MRRTRLRGPAIGLLAVGLTALLAACGSDNGGGSTSTGAGASTTSKKAVGMALVLPCGSSDPWCNQGYNAAKKLASEGVVDLKVTTGAPQDTAGASQVIRQYAQTGKQLVVAYSTWADATNPVATKFPKTNFATFGIKPTENVALFDEPIYQGAYLAGMLAGAITKSNIISGAAGQDVPLCHAEMEAFQAGAKRTNPKVKQLTTYVGDWNDAAKSQQAIAGQVNRGSDVVLACGGAQATGMAQAIKNKKVTGFGYVSDTSSQAPKNIAGTVIYDPYPYFKKMAEDTQAGKFQPAKLYSFGMPQGGVKLELNSSYSIAKIPASVKSEMEKVQQQIMDGSFKVPYVPSGKGGS
jgi:basic membrane lipoprotein Med (substrate-binding protein (PBP1-ABC) superfamily)